MAHRTILSIILLLLFLPSVAAIGLRPGRVDMNFVSVPGGFEKTFPYYISNTLNVPVYATVDSFYEHEAYRGSFTISETEFDLAPHETKPFFVILKLPEEAHAPGEQRIGITATERERKVSSGAVRLEGAVASVFHINGLHEGKYLRLQLNAAVKGENEPVEFTLQARSLGTERINDLQAKIDVFSLPDELPAGSLSATRAESGPLDSWYDTSFRATMDGSSMVKGLYKAIGTVFYDGEQKEVETFFRIGIEGIIIVDHPREAMTGKIHEFPIQVESQYNFPYEAVVAEVEIKEEGKYGRIIRSFQTQPTQVNPFEKKALIGYLDLNGVDLGIYTVNILMRYGGELSGISGEFKVVDEFGNTERSGNRGSGGMLGQRPKKPIFTTTNILIGIIMILIGLNIVWFVVGKKRRPPGKGADHGTSTSSGPSLHGPVRLEQAVPQELPKLDNKKGVIQ